MSMTKPGKAILAAAVTLTLVLLVAHTLQWKRLSVDNVTLALLGILFVLPFVESIKKIRFGEFEAEIAAKEVAAVVAKASSDLPVSQAAGELETPKSSSVLELVRQDPQLGLAKLRIDIEQALRALHKVGAAGKPSQRVPALSSMVNGLERSGELSHDLAASLKEVLSIANRAVHGESVSAESAEGLSMLGVRLIEELWNIYKEKAAEPLQSISVEDAYLNKLSESKYRVITAIPYTRKPVMNVRVLDQDGLNEFLDGYEEFAEFLVSVEPLDAQVPQSLELPPSTRTAK